MVAGGGWSAWQQGEGEKKAHFMETPGEEGKFPCRLKGRLPPGLAAPHDHLAAEHAFERGDHNADGDVGQKAVMNPVAGEADYQVEVLHGRNSVPHEGALGPIGQDRGST
jgi:hypothetical protein